MLLPAERECRKALSTSTYSRVIFYESHGTISVSERDTEKSEIQDVKHFCGVLKKIRDCKFSRDRGNISNLPRVRARIFSFISSTHSRACCSLQCLSKSNIKISNIKYQISMHSVSAHCSGQWTSLKQQCLLNETPRPNSICGDNSIETVHSFSSSMTRPIQLL